MPTRRTLLKLGSALGVGLVLPAFAQSPRPVASTDLLIRHATVLSMDAKLGVLNDGEVLIRDGAIMAVGHGLSAPSATVIDATGMILIPGLVDGHWHLWNSLLRNSAPTPLGPPFFKTQLATSPRFTPQLSALGVRLGLAEAVRGGITTINNWSHDLRTPAFADAELQAMLDSGLRGRFWYGYGQDLPATSPMHFKSIAQLHARMRSAPYEHFDLGLAIRGPERTEPGIWDSGFAFGREHAIPVSTHIAVSQAMQQKKAVQQLAQRGLLGPSVQLVHATHVDADDIRSIASSGASVCLTPLTEMRVGYGLAPVAPLHEAKVAVSLGIDTLVLSGNADQFRVMQTVLNLGVGMSGNEQAITAQEVLHWATQGAADTMGLGHLIGSISVGKRADLVLIDARGLGMIPVTDPFACVVQSASPAEVDTVIADGHVLKRDGCLLEVDVAALAEDVAQGWATLSAGG
ncbi:amidohydrolase family protein [Pseudomonas aeruginosa]|nr:amidohydrolase family protein [Pseudomonas aeruginosa]